MKKNIGSIDKAIRLTLVAVVVLLYFTNIFSGTVALIAGVLALVFLLTNAISVCPLYLPFGISTMNKKQ